MQKIRCRSLLPIKILAIACFVFFIKLGLLGNYCNASWEPLGYMDKNVGEKRVPNFNTLLALFYSKYTEVILTKA